MSQAKLEVKSELSKLVQDLQKISERASLVSEELKSAGKDVGEELEKETKKVETFFSKLGNVGRRAADQLRRDFKSLASLQSLSAGLKLSNQFAGSIKETINLSDAIRKLGSSFGIAQKDFASLQSDITKGMGDIGMSSEEAGDTIRGLAGSGVEGKEPLKAYSMRAAQLSSLGGEKGQSGNIAGMLAGVVRAQGKNVNDPKAMEGVASAVAKAMEGTGKSASDLLSHMQATFESMTAEQRKKTSASGLSSLAVAETVAGPQAAAAIQKYLSMNKNERSGLDAQGFSKIFNKEGGIDIQGLKDFAKDMKQRGLDLRGSAQSYGFSGEEAEGLVRLTQSADLLDKSLKKTAKASDDINTKTRKNMGLNETFQANINRVKAMVSGPMAAATQGITDMLSSASESTTGSAGIVAGGGALAALLAGGGLSGLGKGLGLGDFVKEATVGQAKKQALEQLTGEKIQDVNVVNVSDLANAINGSGSKASVGGGAMGMVGKIAKGAAVLGAVDVAANMGDQIMKSTPGNVPGMQDANKWDEIFYKFDKILGGSASKKLDQNAKITVEMKDPRLKATKQTSRGAAAAPSRY
jgi:hypothetical protein